MPPCAAPVCERVGYSLVMTAVLALGAGLDRGAHAGAAGTHDDDVVAVVVHAVDDVAVLELPHAFGLGSVTFALTASSRSRGSSVGVAVAARQGSKVVSTSVPSRSRTTVATPQAERSTERAAARARSR